MQKDEFEAYIRAIVSREEAVRLPTMHALSKQHAIARPQVKAVIHALRDQGILAISRRGGIVSQKQRSPALQSTITREEALYRSIRSRIESGMYRIGQPLPKTGFMAKSEKVWTVSVGRAYQRLASEGIAHRKGRLYIAGQSTEFAPNVPGNRTCILMIELNETASHDPRLSFWTMPFAQSFMREMSLYSIESLSAGISNSKGQKAPWVIPHGQQGIKQIIEDLGNRLQGTLIISVGAQLQGNFGETIYPFFEWLCSFKKPVVYFDSPDDAGPTSARPESHTQYIKCLKHPLMQKYFVRCYPDYTRAETIPLELLTSVGHRVAGFVDGGRLQSWIRTRLLSIRHNSASMTNSLSVLSSRECPPLFGVHKALTADCFYAQVKKHFPAAIGNKILEALTFAHQKEWLFSQLPDDFKSLVHLTAHLGAFVLHPAITALIAPCDRHARLYYRWCKAAGITIPRDLTLISFDDRHERLYPYTISSVNYGIGDLGYVAFHLLLGDMSLKPDVLRSIKSRCYINHFATIGDAAVKKNTLL